MQRNVDRVSTAWAVSDIGEGAGAGEEFAVFMEGDGHYAVGAVEGFFDAIAVVDVDVDVEDSLVCSG